MLVVKEIKSNVSCRILQLTGFFDLYQSNICTSCYGYHISNKFYTILMLTYIYVLMFTLLSVEIYHYFVEAQNHALFPSELISTIYQL